MKLTVAQIENSYLVPMDRSYGYADIRAYWIPMCYHADVLDAYRRAGIKIRTRFRGPRDPNRLVKAANGTMVPRGRYSAQMDCLKCEATHFTVYLR